MYNDKGNTKYLKLLKQNYSSSQDVIREIVNLSAIINLPKGTEFLSSFAIENKHIEQIFPYCEQYL